MAKIVSFNAFLRGTGRSHLIANIAALLAADGKRVGVVDLDDTAPTLHLFFGLAESAITFTLADHIAGRCRVDQTGYEVTPQQVAAVGGHIFLVPLTSEPECAPRSQRAGIDTERLSDAIGDLTQALSLDYLLTDSGSGVNELSLTGMATSDVAVFVLRLDRHDYQGTAVMLDLARKLEVPRLVLVVNMVSESLNSQEVRARIIKSYGSEVAGVLPYTTEMAAHEGAGLFVLDHPEHQLTAVLRKVANQI